MRYSLTIKYFQVPSFTGTQALVRADLIITVDEHRIRFGHFYENDSEG